MNYDAIIVGARCAGSPTAMLLAQRGHRVLLVDRATFPSDTLSTHVTKIPAVVRLKRWGLLDEVLAAARCTPIRSARIDFGALVLSGSAPGMDGVDIEYAPKRLQLDKVLIDAAAAAGAEVRTGFSVESLVWDGDRVVGIRGHDTNGSPAPIVERAPIVIGADGMRSLVARQVAAAVYREHPSLTSYYFAYWSGIPLDRVELYVRPNRIIIAFPTNDGQTCLLIGWTNAEFHEYRANVELNYLSTLALTPDLAERVHSARRESRFFGTADLPNFFRHPVGPGWALVGDAGLHRDPITAQGIVDAFRDAELLSDAVHAGMSGERSTDDALARYHQQRDQAATPMYDFTVQLATLAPQPPDMLALLGALPGNQPQIDRFVGMIVGTVAVQDFLAPGNVEQIMKGAVVGQT